MIQLDDYLEIGSLKKTHGTQGEMALVLTNNFAEFAIEWQEALLAADCLMLLIDNIPVPFYLEGCRYKTDDVLLLSFEGIENEHEAKKLIGCRVYADKRLYETDDVPIASLIGYKIIEQEKGEIGIVTDIDDTTINTLLLLDSGKVIPIHDDFITDINQETKEIIMSLPEGLLD